MSDGSDSSARGLTQFLTEQQPLFDQPPDSAGRLAYRAFEDAEHHFDDLYAVYCYLYGNAPIFRSDITLDHVDAFEYCKQRRYFTLICPYTDGRQLLVERTFTDKELSWILIGGSVLRDHAETFIDAAGRHADRTLPGIALGEIEPLAFFENKFHFKGETHIHLGLGFVARIRSDAMSSLRRAVDSYDAYLLDARASLPPFSLNHNKAMAELAAAYVNDLTLETPEDEIAENLRYQQRYRFHDRLIKPLLRRSSRYAFDHSLDELDGEIVRLINEHSRDGAFLDIACGDNELVLEIAQTDNFSLVVGNDVSWSQIQLLAQRPRNAALRDHAALTLFTNHDARHLPFADERFSVGFAKNVLHHMDGLPSVRALVEELIRVSRIAIIVEVMDPAVESRWGRLRHQYYMQFLKDAGSHFLSRREFAELTGRSERVTLSEMATIRGVYQFAVFNHEGIDA